MKNRPTGVVDKGADGYTKGPGFESRVRHGCETVRPFIGDDGDLPIRRPHNKKGHHFWPLLWPKVFGSSARQLEKKNIKSWYFQLAFILHYYCILRNSSVFPSSSHFKTGSCFLHYFQGLISLVFVFYFFYLLFLSLVSHVILLGIWA